MELRDQHNMDTLSSVFYLVWVSILGLELIVSLILNLLLLRLIKVVLGGRLRHPKLRHFLVSLLLVNLLLTVVALPIWIYILVRDITDIGSHVTYKTSAIFYYSIDLVYGVLVLLHVLVLIMERLYAIGWPIQHRIAADLPDYLTCATVWVMAVLCSLVAIMLYLYQNFKYLALVVSALCFPVPLLTCLGLYVVILIKKKRQSFSTEVRHKDFKLARTIALAALSFTAFCIPLHVVNAVYHTCTTCNIPYFETIMALRCLQYSFAIVIDVLFLFGIEEFRSRVAWCFFQCCSINEHSENDLFHMDIPGVPLSNPGSSQCTLTRASKKDTHALEQAELSFTNDHKGII